MVPVVSRWQSKVVAKLDPKHRQLDPESSPDRCVSLGKRPRVSGPRFSRVPRGVPFWTEVARVRLHRRSGQVAGRLVFPPGQTEG